MEEFKLRNFYHLLDCDFHIPCFQRGYRWEKKQIENLLYDLKEFYIKSKNVNGSAASYYCLQPIVVKKRQDGDNSFDVLDGQQRLTTIYLILTYLEKTIEKNIKLFSLHFEMREGEEGDYIAKKKFENPDDKDYTSNIDNFYIFKAYEIIKKWFDANGQITNEIAKLLVAPPENGDDKDNKDVRVIWYEIGAGEDRIEVFSRLNYGKIGLTETELIKALILQCDIYGIEKKYMSQWALKVASDWDRIERKLQEPNFWAMLASDEQQKLAENTLVSRISIILDFVVKSYLSEWDSKLKSYKYKFDNPEDDNKVHISKHNSRYVYDVINKYLSEDDGIPENEAVGRSDFKEKVAKLWECVLDIFSILKDWYENNKTFHLLGLLRLLRNKDEGLILSLYEKYTGRESFQDELNRRIGEEVRISSKSKDENGIERTNTLDTINYIENPKEIIRILELFNVYLMIESNHDGARFDFAKFREQNVTSLEHIHPQNLDETEIKFEDLKEWVKRKGEELKRRLNEEGSEEKKTKLSGAFSYFDAFTEEKHKNDRENWIHYVNVIDAEFDELAKMNRDVMHSIKNLALIDKDTNAAMQNFLLDEKRSKLKERSKQGTYIPIGTWQVFNKFFSDNVSELKFWGEEDREAYYRKIKEVYNEYVK